MLIAFAGLQATGKSTLAKKLQQELSAILLDKDSLRACLFGDRVDYSALQNDLCVNISYQLSAYHLKKDPKTPIILDGRTYSKSYQVVTLKQFAKELKTDLRLIECICSEESTKKRLLADKDHLAKDRDFSLYQRIKAAADPIPEPKLVIDTDIFSPEESLAKILAYIFML
ncbi:MAG: ATP-binding protein [Deinococcales bacterium]